MRDWRIANPVSQIEDEDVKAELGLNKSWRQHVRILHCQLPFDELIHALKNISKVSRSMPLVMNTSFVRRSWSGHSSSQTGSWKTCCTPWMTSGTPGLSKVLTMPLMRRMLSPCVKDNASNELAKASIVTGSSKVRVKARISEPCRLTSW